MLCGHGAGYSSFEHASHGIHATLTQFVVTDAPGQGIRVAGHQSGRTSAPPLRYAVRGMGAGTCAGRDRGSLDHRARCDHGVLFARNPFSADFGERVAFADLAGQQRAWTCDRLEFLGRGGSVEQPAALVRDRAPGAVGRRGPRPLRRVEHRRRARLRSRAKTSIVLLGEAESKEAARELIKRMRGADTAQLLEQARRQWDAVLGRVQVRTPEPALDVLLNRLARLPDAGLPALGAYRVLSGGRRFRVPGPTAGLHGADDVRAGADARPPAAGRRASVRGGRRSALVASALGPGVRTHCSDDRLWLPFALAHYCGSDRRCAVLDEPVPFPHRARACARPRGQLFRAAAHHGECQRLRALRARDRPQSAGRTRTVCP